MGVRRIGPHADALVHEVSAIRRDISRTDLRVLLQILRAAPPASADDWAGSDTTVIVDGLGHSETERLREIDDIDDLDSLPGRPDTLRAFRLRRGRSEIELFGGFRLLLKRTLYHDGVDEQIRSHFGPDLVPAAPDRSADVGIALVAGLILGLIAIVALVVEAFDFSAGALGSAVLCWLYVHRSRRHGFINQIRIRDRVRGFQRLRHWWISIEQRGREFPVAAAILVAAGFLAVSLVISAVILG